MQKTFLMMLAGLAVAGCEPLPTDANGTTIRVPEQVIAVAAPGQDLTTARVLEEDGCYWYVHVNAVESTMLPLRTSDGRPICTRPRGTPAS